MERRRALVLAKQKHLERTRARCSQLLNKARIESRMSLLDSRRDLGSIKLEITPEKKIKNIDRRKQFRAELLEKWKEDRKKAIIEERNAKKPAFKVGILQRKVTGSPLKLTNAYANKNFLNPVQLKHVNTRQTTSAASSKSGVTTRAQARNLRPANKENIPKTSVFSRVVNYKMKPVGNYKFTVPQAVSNLSKQTEIGIKVSGGSQAGNKTKPKSNKNKKSMNDATQLLKFENNWKPESSESSKTGNQEDHLKAAVDNDDDKKTQAAECAEEKVGYVPIHYSPYVTKTRGSDCMSPRKMKASLVVDVDQIIEEEEKIFRCRIFSFRKYIDCQTKRLMDLCSYWKKISTDHRTEIPQEIEEEILSLCGKSNLLTSDKFAQFKDLVEKCENRDPMINIDDLQGYQDWVSIEIEKLDKSFSVLEARRNNHWQPKVVTDTNTEQEKKVKQVKIKASKKPTVRSNIREHIQAARKLKQLNDMTDLKKLDTWIEAKASSPVCTPKNKNPLLRDFLNSEMTRLYSPIPKTYEGVNLNGSGFTRRCSGLEIMMATHHAKFVTPGKTVMNSSCTENTWDVQNDDVPIKSILKRSPTTSSANKHSVQFKLSRGHAKENGLDERYFKPLSDDDDEYSSLSMALSDITVKSPGVSKSKRLSTPVRRSERLAAIHNH